MAPRTLILTDTETTGLDHTKDACIEVAVCVWSLEHRTTLSCYSTLIEASGNAAESINRIPAAALVKAKPKETAWRAIYAMADGAAQFGDSVFVAHRAEFDRGFFPKAIAERWPWVCSKFDITWPRSKPGASLVEVALAHDVPVAFNHRALADVLLLVRIFERVAELGYDIDAMIAKAMRPKALFEVEDKTFDAERNAQAKALGFAWEAATKSWRRHLAIEDAPSLPFRVRQVTAPTAGE